MNHRINIKRLILASIIIIIINIIIGNFLYMNPLVSGIYAQFTGHQCIKSMEDFGGVTNWVLLMLGFGILLNVFFIFIFISIHKYIPGKIIIKGLLFGITIAIIKSIPEAFNQFMIFKYPGILIITQLINTIIGNILFGIYMSIIFKKMKVFKSGETE